MSVGVNRLVKRDFRIEFQAWWLPVGYSPVVDCSRWGISLVPNLLDDEFFFLGEGISPNGSSVELVRPFSVRVEFDS